ncbi:hypothetical protein [Limnobacter parvus]|uniref:Type III secretion system chaperone n=1 Tax=Limnobacter parvus TaxID=2939690 RepID=A0ABT1XKJ0_9BURK|nr:hypothetical protein [Limnobacter parvus]MCR2746792.1 hypothetical protein [Limnobacter parvus]
MTLADTEQAAESDAYRIDYEQNLTIELQHLKGADCRVSARIFCLGKSLQVQDDQLRMAMGIFSELLNDLPNGTSMAISDHDNCLRICIEITSENADQALFQFNQFIHVAFAYKQTYFQHKTAI